MRFRRVLQFVDVDDAVALHLTWYNNPLNDGEYRHVSQLPCQ